MCWVGVGSVRQRHWRQRSSALVLVRRYWNEADLRPDQPTRVY